MFPAARKGDPITHDLTVPCGVIGPPPTGPCPQGPVLIEGLPAAHVGCVVVCTGVISAGIAHPPPPPTPPVPIVLGAMTVLIHGAPAARWAPAPDMGGCGVFLGDPTLAASRTVLIGDAGGGGGGGGAGGGGGQDGNGGGDGGGSGTDQEPPPEQKYADTPPTPQPPGQSPQNVGTGTHWIEIEMVDGAEQPLVGESYVIRPTDGKEIAGALDEKGQGRITGIKNPGACQIKFPDLDLAAWERWRPGPAQPPPSTSSVAPPPTGAQPAGPVPQGPPTSVGQWRRVIQGECVSSIAKDTGHFWNTIWDHPANAELKRRRGNPNILMAGDAVYVPVKRPKEESGNTDLHHKFRRRGEPSLLRLRLMDGDQPRANIPYTVEIDGRTMSGVTDAQGNLEVPIPGNARRGRLLVGPEGHQTESPLELGEVDPVTEITGVQARLNNIGYGCGTPDSQLGPQTRQALIRFQEAYNLPGTGEPDAATQAKLVEVHGS